MNMPNISQTGGHQFIRPMAKVVRPPTIRVSQSDDPAPIRFEMPDADHPPMMPPIAPPVPMTANSVGVVSSTSCEKSTSVEADIMPSRFRSPRMIAIGRSRSCPHSHRKPSANSVRHGFRSTATSVSGGWIV
jgi:hypothetical protein